MRDEYNGLIREISDKFSNEMTSVNEKHDLEKAKILSEYQEKKNTPRGNSEDLDIELKQKLESLKDETRQARAVIIDKRARNQTEAADDHLQLGILQFQSDNYLLALNHFQCAAGLGSGEANFRIGGMYMNGQGVPRNESQALKFFILSSEQQYELADIEIEALTQMGIETTDDDTPIPVPAPIDPEKNLVSTRARFLEVPKPPQPATPQPTKPPRVDPDIWRTVIEPKEPIHTNPEPIHTTKPNPQKAYPDPIVLSASQQTTAKPKSKWAIQKVFSSLVDTISGLLKPSEVPSTITAKKTQLSCKECIQGLSLPYLQNTLESCEYWIEQFAKGELPNPHKLNKDELLAIAIYTSDVGVNGKPEDNVYFQLNQALRSDNSEDRKIWDPYLSHFQSALAKIPDEVTVAFRGVGVSSFASIKTYGVQPGNRTQTRAFVSASRSASSAMEFAGPGGVVMRFSLCTGKDISHYSVMPSEAEVILSPNMTFLVMESLRYIKEQWTISLLQESPNSTFVF